MSRSLVSFFRACTFLFVWLTALAAVFASQTANAQTFRFTWSGTISGAGIGSQLIDISILINASLKSGTTNHYDVTGFTNGTVTDKTDDGVNLSGAIEANPSTTPVFGSLTPRNEFFSSGGATGVNGYFAPTAGSDIGGFRFASTTGHEYLIYGGEAPPADQMYILDNGVLPIGNFMTSGGADAFSITQSPGPLAGAGILSYLVTILLGLAWRHEWLRSQARHMVVRLQNYCDKLTA